MERLQRALDLHRSTDRSGLHIKREMSYQYQAPNSSQSNPTAVVTIDSLTVFLHDRTTSPKPKTPSQPEAGENLQLQDFNLDDPFAQSGDAEFSNFLNRDQAYIPEENQPALTVDAPVPARRKKESKTFDLVYRQGKWQLKKEPEGEYERSLFQYALED
ncbi:MAG: hypothetical protein MI725_16975 [Pirellulales bacterium]|nr:hypothetical protein [Pirellulales bacterium]